MSGPTEAVRAAELIRVERDDSIATVVLDRPHKLNALTRAMWAQLGETIDALSSDDALRCILVRGAGEKAFSPGNDIGEFATQRSSAGGILKSLFARSENNR